MNKNETLNEFKLFSIKCLREAAARQTPSLIEQNKAVWAIVETIPRLKKLFKEDVPCPQCSGLGSVDLTVHELGKPETSLKIDCPTCSGIGKVSPQRQESLIKEQEMWCKCSNSEGIYVENHACTCGIEKHHWHCDRCRKIKQIG